MVITKDIAQASTHSQKSMESATGLPAATGKKKRRNLTDFLLEMQRFINPSGFELTDDMREEWRIVDQLLSEKLLAQREAVNTALKK